MCMCFTGPKLNADTQAALKAFNAYRPQLQMLDAVEVGAQLIRYRLISRKGGTHSGEAVHLPNEIKMNLILPEVEHNISLNGPEVLFMLATALSELPPCVELSTQLKGICYIRIYVCVYMHTYVYMYMCVVMYVRT